MVKRAIAILTLTIVVLTSLAPQRAEAIPKKFRGCPEATTSDGTRYLLYKRLAILTKCANRRTVKVPRAIRVRGKRYAVRNVWDGAWQPRNKVWVIDADLEAIEDAAPWDGRVRVRTNNKFIYRWLKRTGARVTH